MLETIRKNEELIILGIILIGTFILLANRVEKLNKINISNSNISLNVVK